MRRPLRYIASRVLPQKAARALMRCVTACWPMHYIWRALSTRRASRQSKQGSRVPFFFIDRPVFAWIVALAIVVAGALAIPQLPVAQYPRLAPPRIVISATYPGA